MKKIIILIICIVLLFAEQSYSLTDQEYNKLLSSFYEFQKYDKDLNNLWKILMRKIHPTLKKDLLDDQRYYVNKGRDINVNNLFYRNVNKHNNDISKLDRYILSTKKG